jgi:hypothetical protein
MSAATASIQRCVASTHRRKADPGNEVDEVTFGGCAAHDAGRTSVLDERTSERRSRHPLIDRFVA